MTHGLKLVWLAAISLLGMGCTSMLHEDNVRYAQESRELRRTNQRLVGTYAGLNDRNGTLCEVYQFESPFRKVNDDVVLEVAIPVYGNAQSESIRIRETRRLLEGEQSAELWFWHKDGMPGKSKVVSENGRRIDILWSGGDHCILRRCVPGKEGGAVQKWDAPLKIPWNRRNRFEYAARHLAYACTVPADVVAGLGVATVIVAVECPCLFVAILHAID